MDAPPAVSRRRRPAGGVPLVRLPQARPSRSKKNVESPGRPPVIPRRPKAAAVVPLVPPSPASRSKKPVVLPGRLPMPRRGGSRVPVRSPFACKKSLLPPPLNFVGYIASGLPKRKYDGFFPVFSSEVTAMNRKKRKIIHDRWCGRLPDHQFASPLEPSWVGFTEEEVDILKAGYIGRSFYGGPAYRCLHCKSSYWCGERVRSTSTDPEERFVYNLCCKGGKVFIDPFKEPPQFLLDLLKFDGLPQAKEFIAKIRQYNCLFAFTSMGATIDRSINNGGGPNIFKISGAICHRIGSLLPNEGDAPKFAELYCFHGGDEIDNRIQALSREDRILGSLDRDIVDGLMLMLDAHNSLVKKFRMAKEILLENEFAEVSIRLIGPGKDDGPQFSLPSTDELACLVVGELTLEKPCRDIIIRGKGTRLQRISSLHPAYMALQYPLLFPFGERGFQLGLPYRAVDPSNPRKRKNMTMQDYYCFCSHYKEGQHNPYLSCGLLSDQAIVDSRVCIDEARLNFILLSNNDLRAENLQGLVDAVGAGRMDGSSVGRKNILPSSYTGGRRYMIENFQDAVAIARVHGCPDIFSTFTCNPKWPEIIEALSVEPGQKPHNRADISVRVYHMKLNEYLRDIRSGKAYGKVVAVLHTVEFQKRGLPHAHILTWQDKKERPETSPALIDSFICAEIPDPLQDPLGYALVAEFMMHGPCGEENPKCPCMKDGLCSKKFPKEFQEETSIDEKGFPIYRRPDNGRFIFKNKVRLDNRHVVPYNMAMLKKYQAHLNVEWCNKTQVIKYLYKYVTKGPDYSKALFDRIRNSDDPNDEGVDEIEEYRACRYVCNHDSFWRCYGYDIHSKTPSVERLAVHLLNKHVIRFRAKTKLKNIVDDPLLKKTMLTEWFVANRIYESARSLTYCDFPTKWSWNAQGKKWKKRKCRKKIGRIYYVHPSTTELYYLRMLLMRVKGAKSYADVRTYNGVVYETFKDACGARGLLGDDNEWFQAFDEALNWGMGKQLRQLFVTMILFCGVINENGFFEKYWSHMGDDIQYRICHNRHDPLYRVPDDQLRNLVLDELGLVFAKNGSNILDHNLPRKSVYDSSSQDSNMISDELCEDFGALIQTAECMLKKLNKDQEKAFKSIIDRVREDKPGLFFVSGHGGTGKTFLWNALITYLRGFKRIVLAVASSGVASLLLPGGRTAHSRFKIPIDLDDNGVCDIRRFTKLASLIQSASLIIWDEALMTHRKCFEALDRSLRDVLSDHNPSLADVPFGGKIVVLGGDLRQILPVIEGGTRSQVVNSAITNSPLWNHVMVLHLTINMRLAVETEDLDVQAEAKAFDQWVLSIGNGTVPAVAREGESDPTWISIPSEHLVHTDGPTVPAIVNAVYVDFLKHFSDPKYLKERAILTPTNDQAITINDHVLSLVPGEEREYLSYDSTGSSSDGPRNIDIFYPVEVLNTIKVNNFPYHKLILKKGVPIMLLRNISQAAGLCNGTRLIVTRLAEKLIEAVVMTGSNIGDIVYIPRICLTVRDPKWPFTLHRRQFPIRVSYAMTINKSQGQTLTSVGIYLKTPVFTHGQFYVAVSRVTSKKALHILIENEDGTCSSETRNIVFSEIFESLVDK